MKFVFITYRWGEQFTGGAELFQRRLALELIEQGHEVVVLTSCGGAIQPYHHWAVRWEELPSESFDDGPILVRRLPTLFTPRWQQLLFSRLIQRRFEYEEQRLSESPICQPFVQNLPPGTVAPFTGWHHPERTQEGAQRWTHQEFSLAVGGRSTETILRLRGYSPIKNTLKSIYTSDVYPIPRGGFELSVRIGIGPYRIETFILGNRYRPIRDHRTLGLLITDVAIGEPPEVIAFTEMDHRVFLRPLGDLWRDDLMRRGAERPRRFSWMFDRCRGPRMENTEAVLRHENPDHVIAFNLPWATMSSIPDGTICCPFWHTDDEFYAWRHWTTNLQKAPLVLGISHDSADHFFPRHRMRSAFIGAPVWPREIPKRRAPSDVPFTVLTVCRKTPQKGYRRVLQAVEILANEGLPIRFVGVGPDEDGIAIQSHYGEWKGALSDEDLAAEYAGASAFALMSESESFGMVAVEAWHAGIPVIVNGGCPALASLIRHDQDGFAVRTTDQLVECLRRLYNESEIRERLAEAGKQRAQREFQRGSAAKRLLAAIKDLPSAKVYALPE